jgi:hypothetical protein
LAEYAQPICVDNLDVNIEFAQSSFFSDQIFTEEIKVLGSDAEDANDSLRDISMRIGNDPAKQSKEFLDINFKFNYTGDDDKPLSLGIDVSPSLVDQKK